MYRSSLSSSDVMERTYLAALIFAPSGSSALNTAQKVSLLIRSRISAYLPPFIHGQFAHGSFDLMISVNQHCDRLDIRVREFLVSLKYPREIICISDGLLVLVATRRSFCVCWHLFVVEYHYGRLCFVARIP